MCDHHHQFAHSCVGHETKDECKKDVRPASVGCMWTHAVGMSICASRFADYAHCMRAG